MPEPVKFKTVDEACQVYVDTRDALRLHMKAAKAKEDELKELLEQISMWLRDKADEIGVDSFKTKHGTAYRNSVKKYRIMDWDTFSAWMLETGNLQCVEKRVAKLATEEIRQAAAEFNMEHEGDEDFVPRQEVPPGLDFFIEVEFNVMRPKKAAE